MQEYDVALKLLLQGQAKLTIHELAGGAVEKWLDVELPKVQNLRMDLLGETGGGNLIHVELQSTNDAAMALRMAEYCFGCSGYSADFLAKSYSMSVKRRFAWQANSKVPAYRSAIGHSIFAIWTGTA